MHRILAGAALAAILVASPAARADDTDKPCVKRTGRAVKPGVNYCEEAASSAPVAAGPIGSIPPAEMSDRAPTTHEICLANQAHYPDLVKDGKPLTAYQVCLWAWHSRDPALIWCLQRWEEDHALKRYGTMEECILEAREHQRAEEAARREEVAEEMAERWDAYYQQQAHQQQMLEIIRREQEERQRVGRVLGTIVKGLSGQVPGQVNCTTTRYGNIAQTVCQ